MSLTPTAVASERRKPAVEAALLVAIFAASVVFYWYGVGPGDAERYIEAALRWQDGPWLGDTHWALRHFFVLPMAASFQLLGTSEFAAILPNILFAASTIALTWIFGRRYLGEREALVAAALIAASAFFVARPLELDVYGAEAFFAAFAVWVFIAARDGRARNFAAAGIIAGLAWTVREQSIYLIAAFGVLILKDRPDPLRAIAFLAVGFGAVIAAELVFYAVAAADPLYRYRIDLSHRDIGVNIAMTPERARIDARAGRLFTYLATTAATTPMLVFGAASLFYLRRSRAQSHAKAIGSLRIFAVAAVLSAIIASLAFNLSATRYYPLLTYAAFLMIAVAIVRLHGNGRPRAALAAILAVVAVNIAAADFTRDGDYDEARVLAAIARSASEPIFSDSLTVNRTRYQLRLAGWTAAAASRSIQNERFANAQSLLFKTSRFEAPDGPVCIIDRIDARKNGWTHALLRNSGLASFLGARAEKIVARPAPALLLRGLEKPAPVDSISGKPCI